jgi:hypothetical protein
MSTPTPTPGRRIATRQRRRMDRGTLVGAGAVALTALLLAAASAVQAEPEPPARPTTAPVDRSTAACLGARTPGTAEPFTLAAPLPAEVEGVDEDGTLETGTGDGPGSEVGPGQRGSLRPLDAPAADEALVVSATGGQAVGRATFQVDTSPGDALVGVQECLPPRSSWWFTGGGAGLDHRSRLVMANVDPGPAVVDVVVHGPDGAVDSVSTRGITIAPGDVRTLDLVEVAPQSDELAVHVEASRGRVVAGLADAFATRPGATPGHEWVPAQTETAREVRLAPLPRRADGRTLVVANPNDREALVDVEVSGESGAFAPTDVAQVRVPPESVVTADLGQAVGGDASAVLLRSPVPVTATVRSAAGADVSYAAVAPVLTGPSAAVLVDGSQAGVHLTAGDERATATVTAYADDGSEVESAEVEVPPTATLAWTPEGAAAYVVVTPGEGSVAGGVALAGDAGLSQVPLRPLPIALRQPVVVQVVR